MESKRQRQVAEMIKRNFGLVLQQEGSYIYEDAFVTVTGVKVTPDLSLAKIYLSVFNVLNKESVIVLMEQNNKRLRQALANRVRRQIRRVPEISFYIDDTLDEMYRLNQLFDKLHNEKQMGEEE
ncbi:MAG: 30S ribosome-binding factor RbfA [Bacteroidota bacterium]